MCIVKQPSDVRTDNNSAINGSAVCVQMLVWQMEVPFKMPSNFYKLKYLGLFTSVPNKQTNKQTN